MSSSSNAFPTASTGEETERRWRERIIRHGLHVLQAESAARPPQLVARRFIFLRHGETDGNHQRVLQHPDIELNRTGIDQADAAAGVLANCGVQRIVASDVRRAWQTAEIMARRLGVEAHPEPRLRERWFGDWIGHSSSDLNWAAVPPNGEALVDFVTRARNGFEAALSTQTPTLIVAHGGTLYALIFGLGLWPTEEMVKNATPLLFEKVDQHWTVQRISELALVTPSNIGW